MSSAESEYPSSTFKYESQSTEVSCSPISFVRTSFLAYFLKGCCFLNLVPLVSGSDILVPAVELVELAGLFDEAVDPVELVVDGAQEREQ